MYIICDFFRNLPASTIHQNILSLSLACSINNVLAALEHVNDVTFATTSPPRNLSRLIGKGLPRTCVVSLVLKGTPPSPLFPDSLHAKHSNSRYTTPYTTSAAPLVTPSPTYLPNHCLDGAAAVEPRSSRCRYSSRLPRVDNVSASTTTTSINNNTIRGAIDHLLDW